MLIQQGDVLLKSVETIPTSTKVERMERGLVLMEGEATGHAHVITEPGPELYEVDGTLYLHVPEEAEIHHEEHDTVTVPAGDYEIDQVREHDNFRFEDLAPVERPVID